MQGQASEHASLIEPLDQGIAIVQVFDDFALPLDGAVFVHFLVVLLFFVSVMRAMLLLLLMLIVLVMIPAITTAPTPCQRPLERCLSPDP
jgi:hypothetical protein